MSPPAKNVSLLSLTCCEATRLASEGMDRQLSRRERWALRFHAFLCASCRRFEAQLKAIRAATSMLPAEFRQKMSENGMHLSADRRETIKRLLSDAMRADRLP